MKSQNLSHGLGAVLASTPDENSLHIKSEFGHINVATYGPNVIRVDAYKEAPFQHSYAVIASPEGTPEKQESESTLRLTTSALSVEIDKSTTHFSFLTPQGSVINADETGLGISWIGDQVTTYKKLQSGERFLGLGEKTGPLDRRGKAYQNWNTDQYAYGSGTDPLYSSVPFYIGIHSGLCYGIYLDNTNKTHFNFGASNDRFSSFSADRGDMNYYFIYGETVAEVIRHYTRLTGAMPLPPLWSIGYQQCRYSYYPDKEVLSLARMFQEKQIPADVIVLDIHYMENFKIFTWDKEHFKDPEGMIKSLRQQGFHVVVMCDPGIKVEAGYEAYESGKEADVFVKYPDGTNYTGEVWPGWCHFPDFTHPEARTWWKEKLKAYTDLDIDGFWNDMNEIATWGNALPELIEFEFDGHRTTAREGRNVYGMQMARSTYEGTKALLKNRRPFNLTRAGFSGIQRYAAVWTGDNVASDEHMMLGIRMVNSMGLSGIAFAGYDIGGFVGNASEHLFARWIQAGAFSPFFRGHSMVNSRDSEPWSYGEEVEEISRNFIKLRYMLMPYVYSCFFEASETGMPVSRSLAIYYPDEAKIYEGAYEQQYLFGPAVLVAPMDSTQEFAKVFLPEGRWYQFFTDEMLEGDREMLVECSIETIPLYIKESAIVPMAPQVGLNTTDLGDVLELHIYEGTVSNSFEYYEDDGTTFNYENGEYHKRTIVYNPGEGFIEIGAASGQMDPQFSTIRICLHGFKSQGYKISGEPVPLKHMDYRYIEPISNFDPIGTPGGDFKLENLGYLELENTKTKVRIDIGI